MLCEDCKAIEYKQISTFKARRFLHVWPLRPSSSILKFLKLETKGKIGKIDKGEAVGKVLLFINIKDTLII